MKFGASAKANSYVKVNAVSNDNSFTATATGTSSATSTATGNTNEEAVVSAIQTVFETINKNNNCCDNNCCESCDKNIINQINEIYNSYNVNIDTSLFCKLPCKQKILNLMKQTIIENNSLGLTTNFNISNIDSQSLPYIELLYPDYKTQTYYVYSSTNTDNYFYTVLGNELVVQESDVYKNEKRFYVWNYTIKSPNVVYTNEYPQYKYIPFKNANNVYQIQDLIATTPIISTATYQETTVERNTIYVYRSGTLAFFLIDTINKKIYAMQTATTATDPNITFEQLYLLNEKLLNVPSGWIYTYTQIADGSCLLVYATPNNPAYLVQDELGNSYQYVYPKYNEFIYYQLTPST